MPTVAADIETALRETPGLGLGVHLLLTAGSPLTPVDQILSLVKPDGAFLKLEQLIARQTQLDLTEVSQEWRAQIEKFITTAGCKPTHLDSHHHVTYFTPGLFKSFLELAKEYDLPIRLPVSQDASTSLMGLPAELHMPILEDAPRLLEQFQPRHPTAFFSSFYNEQATKEELFSILHSLRDGTFELMSHPGYSDPDLASSSGYAAQRERELAILTDAETLLEIGKLKIQLINFDQL